MSKARHSRYVSEITGPEKEVLDRALDVVQKWSGLQESDIVGRRRFQSLIDARHFWWMLCLRAHPFTLSRLGELVDRDHGSIIHARDRHHNMIEVGQFTYERVDGGYSKAYRGRDKGFKASWEYLCREYAKAVDNEQEGAPTHDEEHANSMV